MDAKERDIKQFYKTLDLTRVKNSKNVKNELMYQLYKTPKEKIKPIIEPAYRNDTHQYDLLYLPHDNGYKYALVAVDVGSKLCDAEALKSRTSKATLDALLTIFKRKILSLPENKINVDDGTEFKADFAKYFKQRNIDVVVAQPNRHRQVALVESRNKSIGDYLMKRMVAQELKTKEASHEWVDQLPIVVKRLNKRFEIKNPKPNDSDIMTCSGNSCDLLNIGDSVMFALDRPVDVVTGKPTDSKFRSADVRYSLQPTQIKAIRLSAVNQPLYALEGQKAYYTRDQLQIVGQRNLPPDSLQSKSIIEKLLDRQKIKSKIHFLVKWENDDVPTWEPRSRLIVDVPNLIKDFEAK